MRCQGIPKTVPTPTALAPLCCKQSFYEPKDTRMYSPSIHPYIMQAHIQTTTHTYSRKHTNKQQQ